MLKFTCPKCGKHRIEEVMVDVVQYSEIKDIDEECLDADYGNTNTDGGKCKSLSMHGLRGNYIW